MDASIIKTQKQILLVDDEVKITQVLSAYLEKEGYQSIVAHDGKTALELFQLHPISLILLDLMLPDIPGEKLCEQIRAQYRIPIIMLTAKSQEQDILDGLEVGADDYLTKPFSPRVVVAKVGAVLRRAESDELLSVPVSYRDGYLVIDFNNKTVLKEGTPIHLTPTEYQILRTLAKAPKRIFTREQLILFALGDDYDGYNRSIDTYIKSLRSKIEPDRHDPAFIVTVHGVGYQFQG